MRPVRVTVVQIVGVISVGYRDVTAARTMVVGVVLVRGVFRCHKPRLRTWSRG